MPVRALLLALLASLAGCHNVAAPPEDAQPRAIYQTIANALPRASLGWGPPPGVALMAASVRHEPAPPLPPLRCDEHGFLIQWDGLHPRASWVPYEAVLEASWGWVPVPNAFLAPFLFLPLQVERTTLVVDAARVEGLLEAIERDAKRLEAISREIGLGGPWSHAQEIRAKLSADAAEHGKGKLTVEFDFLLPVPAWLPLGGGAEEAAEAFAWARAHPGGRPGP